MKLFYLFFLVLFLTSCDSEIDKCVKAQMNLWEELMVGKKRKKTEDRQVEAESRIKCLKAASGQD